jgi:hypothetical protein
VPSFPASQAIRALLVVAAMTLAASCTSEPPEPKPGPRYEQNPRDLCEHAQTTDIAKKFGLRISEVRDVRGRYLELGTYWQAICSFYGVAEQERFRSAAGDFSPQAGMDIRVHDEFSSAERGFRAQAELFQQRADAEGPHLTATARPGWWDESLALISRKDPEPRLAQRPGAITLFDIRYVIRHDNLILLSNISGFCPTSEADEAMTFLDDLLNALMDEHVSHLERSD